MNNPTNDCPDDAVCFACGTKLSDPVEPGSPPDRGFCNEQCEHMDKDPRLDPHPPRQGGYRPFKDLVLD